MILVESKTQTATPSSPLSTAPMTEGEGKGSTLSFSELLHGVVTKKDDNVIQNGALILSLDENQVDSPSLKGDKVESLLSLLSGDEEKLPLELNPKITDALTPKELKVLVSDAKQYLKDQIINSEGFKKSEIAALPKTLKGLAQVAVKFGIDVSKITLQEVKSSTKSSMSISLDIDDKVETKSKKESLTYDDDVEVQTKSTVKKHSNKSTVANTQTLEDEVKPQEQVRADSKIREIPKELKATPLFKAQVTTEITTQQLVHAKATTIEVKTPKQKADDTLKLLLRGDKVTKNDSGMTADFSVATARVLAPSATTESSKSLESLLRGDGDTPSNNSKVDGLNLAKADSFEVKLNEAKQMVKYLSQDVKTAIEDYKSPFTRVKVQLNPQRLGEVDLTIVQRGKNLHISLTSNNAAINTLSMNANDLKLQLSSNGINNASLNFSNNPQSQDGSAQQQQNNHQQRQQANEEYNYFEGEEVNEEILSSLEIVVPNYA